MHEWHKFTNCNDQSSKISFITLLAHRDSTHLNSKNKCTKMKQTINVLFCTIKVYRCLTDYKSNTQIAVETIIVSTKIILQAYYQKDSKLKKLFWIVKVSTHQLSLNKGSIFYDNCCKVNVAVLSKNPCVVISMNATTHQVFLQCNWNWRNCNVSGAILTFILQFKHYQ